MAGPALAWVIVDAMWREGEGQMALRLVAADGGALPPFQPGAHLDLHLPDGPVRPYSIASRPEQTDRYVLCVKREPDSRGGSAGVHERLRVGDRVQVSVPRSAFALVPAEHHVLVAGGIGITPILPMAETLLACGHSVELHYFVRSAAHVAFARRLAAPGLAACTTVHLQSPRNGLPAGVTRWRPGARLFQCGPAGLMALVREAALAGGWPEDRLHQEAFGAPAPLPAAAGDSFEVELAVSGGVYVIPPDRTIAQVLVEAGIAVPLSCEAGMCGACLTRVLSGEVDHRDEVTGGIGPDMTVCCSRALSARLVLAL